MARIIEKPIYCIKTYAGVHRFVECQNEDDLAEFVAKFEIEGHIITSITRMCYDGSRPRVAIKSNTTYKKWIKKLLHEKQAQKVQDLDITKKPTNIKYDNDMCGRLREITGSCPVCGRRVICGMNFCDDCGKKLDWKDEMKIFTEMKHIGYTKEYFNQVLTTAQYYYVQKAF